MSGHQVTDAERSAVLNPNRPVRKEELGSLIDLFDAGRTKNVSPAGADESALHEKTQMDISLKHGPPGENPSNDPRIEEQKEILGKALDLHRTICVERYDEILQSIENPGDDENNPRHLRPLLNSVDHPDRVNPQLITELLNALSEEDEAGYADSIDTDHSTAQNTIQTQKNTDQSKSVSKRRIWNVGGGIVDDLFRVPLLYMRFHLTSDEISKDLILQEMMRIAINKQSFTAYRTAILLGCELSSSSDVVKCNYDKTELYEFELKYEKRLTGRFSLPEICKGNNNALYVEEEGNVPSLARLDKEGLKILISVLSSKVGQTPFSGDGFSVPFQTNHTNKEAGTKQFSITEEYGKFVYAKDSEDKPIWLCMMDSVTESYKTVFWARPDIQRAPIGEPLLVSGEFLLNTADKTLSQANEYMCECVASGGFGSVMRVSWKNLNDDKKRSYAVKFIGSRYVAQLHANILRRQNNNPIDGLDSQDVKLYNYKIEPYKNELASTKAVVEILQRFHREVQDEFGFDFADCFCALDQTGPEAIRLHGWLSTIGETRLHLVLKTLPYDKLTFCKPVNEEIMQQLLHKLLKCCAFFYRFGFTPVYSDWKHENVIWASDSLMLVDIMLHSVIHTPEYYLKSADFQVGLYQVKLGFILYENENKLHTAIKAHDPRWPIRGLYNTCREFQNKFTDKFTSFDNTSGMYNALETEIIEKSGPMHKEQIGAIILDIANRIIVDQSVTSSQQIAGSSSGGSADSGGGRSALLRSLSGLGIVVLTAFLQR